MSGAGPAPFTPEELAGIVGHPRFRAAVQGLAADNLADYASLDRVGRWLKSDLGRASLAGAAFALAGEGRLTWRALESAAQRSGVASRSRVRKFVERAVANAVMIPAGPNPTGPTPGEDGAPLGLDTPLAPGERLVRDMGSTLPDTLKAAVAVMPELEAAWAMSGDLLFRLRIGAQVLAIIAARLDLHPATGTPILMFQTRDGGSRVLEALLVSQPKDRERLLGPCRISRAALARASFCSRPHIRLMLAQAEAAGLLTLEGDCVTPSPALSDDVERQYALVFSTLRVAVRAAAAGG